MLASKLHTKPIYRRPGSNTYDNIVVAKPSPASNSRGTLICLSRSSLSLALPGQCRQPSYSLNRRLSPFLHYYIVQNDNTFPCKIGRNPVSQCKLNQALLTFSTCFPCP